MIFEIENVPEPVIFEIKSVPEPVILEIKSVPEPVVFEIENVPEPVVFEIESVPEPVIFAIGNVPELAVFSTGLRCSFRVLAMAGSIVYRRKCGSLSIKKGGERIIGAGRQRKIMQRKACFRSRSCSVRRKPDSLLKKNNRSGT